MKQIELQIEGKNVMGFEIPLPAAPLVLANGPGGFVMCGYLNIQVANKMGVAAAMVRGVSTVEDLLKAPVQEISDVAAQKGVNFGMTGRQALSIIA